MHFKVGIKLGEELSLFAWNFTLQADVTKEIKLKWATKGDLLKLLGTPFGLSLKIQDLDFFLIDKIRKHLGIELLSIYLSWEEQS